MVSAVDCGLSSHSLVGGLNADLSVDQLMSILVMEESYKVPHIPCHRSSCEGGRLPYGEWRRKICQWSFKVIDHFRLDREVVSCALNIFDRYLAARPHSEMGLCPCPSCQQSVDSRGFQLIAMTSLYLAIKVNSDNSDEGVSPHRRLRLNAFVELSRGQFCAQDITNMEQEMLRDLRWKVHPPSPMTIVSYLLRLMPSYSAVPYECRKSYDLVLHVLHELARYLTELSVCLGSACSVHSPAQVAYASILVSMDLLTESALPSSVKNYFNEAVVRTSAMSGGTILTPNDEPIRHLQERLRNSFWPEMLMDEGDNADAGHPISMARDFGLLDISSISNTPSYSKSPTRKNWEISPVSVSHGAL
eukprot:Nitzschia sp. Nitz4//scaffold31_size150131//74575//75657//NITZ4_002832-RA/size150131-processed-gene-0.111-mRNA-1//1//CDS//3329547671//5020//frame0